MGYSLQGFIARQETLARRAADFRPARVVALPQGFGLIPLTDELFDAIADGSGGDAQFSRLSPGVSAWAKRMSATDPVAYVEAEFFGGTGGQKSIVWSNGECVLGPVEAADAINAALRHLGVRPDAGDEFDAVGLGRHRHTEDWVEGAG